MRPQADAPQGEPTSAAMEHLWSHQHVRPRARVVSDNDYAGDPDGLVQLAHLLLSPSVDVRAIIGSHFKWPGADDRTADRGADAATELTRLCKRTDVPVYTASNDAMTSTMQPIDTPAVRALIDEAMRSDEDMPLFLTAGGPLTTVASAWLLEPRIAERVTLVWIGGHEYDGLAEPPLPGMDLEYNTGLDLIAAQLVFDDSDLNIWQVPRDAYRQVIATRAELLTRVASAGDVGRYLVRALGNAVEMMVEFGVNPGEVYVLGDSPLVSLVALQTMFEAGPASHRWVTMPCPRILASGLYELRPDGRPIRIISHIDNRLIIEDLIAKLTLFDQTKQNGAANSYS